MKARLRLALPPLTVLAPDSRIAFAVFDRSGTLLRSAELPLQELAAAVQADEVQAILHPDDAVRADIELPPLPAKRLEEAVQASVEPMALSDIADLCIAFGPRRADGRLTVVWTER